jgi:hypothetical protein
MRTNAALNVAEAAAIRMPEASARARPPPDAGPLTAAITGCRRLRSFGTRAAMACWTCIRDWLARPQRGRLEPAFSRSASRPATKVRHNAAIEIIGLAARRGEAPAAGWSAPDGAPLQFSSAIGRWGCP